MERVRLHQRAAGQQLRERRLAEVVGARAEVLARIAGRPPDPFRFGFLLQCISLGRHDALVQLVRSDDSPRDLVLSGRPAAVVNESIVRGAAAAARKPPLSAFGTAGAPVLRSRPGTAVRTGRSGFRTGRG